MSIHGHHYNNNVKFDSKNRKLSALIFLLVNKLNTINLTTLGTTNNTCYINSI